MTPEGEYDSEAPSEGEIAAPLSDGDRGSEGHDEDVDSGSSEGNEVMPSSEEDKGNEGDQEDMDSDDSIGVTSYGHDDREEDDFGQGVEDVDAEVEWGRRHSPYEGERNGWDLRHTNIEECMREKPVHESRDEARRRQDRIRDACPCDNCGRAPLDSWGRALVATTLGWKQLSRRPLHWTNKRERRRTTQR